MGKHIVGSKALAVAAIILLTPMAQVLSPSAFSQSSSPSPTYVRVDSNYIYIGNGFIELQLLKSNGGIYAVINNMTSEDYITDKSVYPSLFWIGTSSGISHASSFCTCSFSYTYTTNDTGAVLTLKYSFTSANPAIVTTTVRVTPNSSLTYWRMSIDNVGRAQYDNLDFPEVSGIAQVGNQTADNYLLLGDDPGSMLTNVYYSFTTNSSAPSSLGTTYPSSYGPIQMMVLGNSYGGLYMATYDNNGNAKAFYADRRNDTQGNPMLFLSVSHLLPEEVNSTLATPYDTVLGVFSGSWYSAADMYRSWAMGQWWTAQGPLYQRTDVPAWFKRGFVTLVLEAYNTYEDPRYPGVTNFVYANFSQIPQKLEQYLAKDNSPVLALFAGWEKYGEWVAPDVFPPFEGWASFNKTISEIHAMGQHVIVGLSADTLWTWVPGFNSTWLECAARGPDGSLEQSSGFPLPLYIVSPACAPFQNWLVNTITTLARAGVDGVELDGAWTTEPYDFSNSTTHAPGFGTWWVSDWVSILQRIKSSVSSVNPDFVIASEGLPEEFIPWVQMYWDDAGNPTLSQWAQEFSGVKLTGLFDYVYSGYTIGFSRQTWRFPQSVSYASYSTYRDFAQALGTSLGVAVNYASDSANWNPPSSSLARSLIWASSSYFRDFLLFGERIPPPAISVPTTRVYFVFIAVGSPKFNQLSTYETPAVLSSASLSPDGRLGYLFANIDNKSHTFTFEVDTSVLSQSTGLEILFLNESAASASTFDPSKPTVAVDLPPKEALVVEVVPATSASNILLEYNAFKASYITGMAVLAAPTSNPNYNKAYATILASEGAYIAENYSQSISLAQEALNILASTSTSTTSSSESTVTTPTTASSVLTTSSSATSTTPSSSTSSTSTTSNGATSAIPEFPYQLLAVAVTTAVIVVSFVFLSRRTVRAPT
jgi:chemotaxis protein CheY-P-specific phosphatase CheC